jgi:hypothetical protein
VFDKDFAEFAEKHLEPEALERLKRVAELIVVLMLVNLFVLLLFPIAYFVLHDLEASMMLLLTYAIVSTMEIIVYQGLVKGITRGIVKALS